MLCLYTVYRQKRHISVLNITTLMTCILQWLDFHFTKNKHHYVSEKSFCKFTCN
jgi:hypothetical protein